ncbi:MAG: hypothetical protein LBD11_01630 [Candidatus Peribacteria bacterium]|jgi:hypothetical protein|nr:hypothetical protein [Candidatus Peribacteria bacterium]
MFQNGKKHLTVIGGWVLLFAILLFTSCADVTPVKDCLPGDPYGFWGGLWHGMIAPFSFFGSLFSDNIAVWAVNNNGNWYSFGFVLGSGILFGGGSSTAKRKR